MNKENIKTFWKNHKSKIVFGATTTAVGIACYLLGNSQGCPIKIPDVNHHHLPFPEKRVGDWESFWVDSDSGRAFGIISDIHVQHLGELGVEIFNHCEDCGLEQVVYDCPVNIMFELASDV